MLTNCKLTIDGQVDASSVESIVQDVTASLPPSAGDEDKVLALYRYVREHLFAFVGTQDDLIEPLNKAIQTLNWWGWGLCGRQAKTLGVLAARLLGPENIRIVGMREREPGAWRTGQDGRPYAFVWTPQMRGWKPDTPGGHTSLEIRWGGRWHFFDAMVGFYRRGGDGQIASLEQIVENPAIADRPVGDPQHGDMPYGPEVEIFTRSNVKFHDPGMNAWPGVMPPLDLRRGERFAFLAEPIDGEFFIHPKMRAAFQDDVSGGGPREARPRAPAARYGNAEHGFEVELKPVNSDPFWCRETADWHVPVELPYPITSIRWDMSPAAAGPQGGECSGFLSFPPSTGDEIVPIPAVGSHHPGPATAMGLGYRLIVRAPRRRGGVLVRLRTIAQHNPLVRPVLKNGRNLVRLAARGRARLVARIDYKLAGSPQSVRLEGVGGHEVLVGPGMIASQSVTLMNG
jgi:hypothetical protein